MVEAKKYRNGGEYGKVRRNERKWMRDRLKEERNKKKNDNEDNRNMRSHAQRERGGEEKQFQRAKDNREEEW